MSQTEHLVDARGMPCPWPVIRLSRMAREVGKGALIRLLADDPIAPREVRALCEERAWHCETDGTEPGTFRIKIP